MKLFGLFFDALRGTSCVMQTVIYIAVFGALGCVARYFLSGWTYEKLGWGFPWGTLSVNVVGAFIIGLIMELGLRNANIPANLRIGLVAGFLGGLTTFSTFSYETFKLLETGRILVAFANVLISVTLCLLFTWLGIVVAKIL
jgi:CrcB protein